MQRKVRQMLRRKLRHVVRKSSEPDADAPCATDPHWVVTASFANPPMVLVILVKANFCCGGRRGPEQRPLGLRREKGPLPKPLFRPLFKTQSRSKKSYDKRQLSRDKKLVSADPFKHMSRDKFFVSVQRQ